MLHVTCSAILSWTDLKEWRHSSREMRPAYHSTVLPANAGTKHGWAQLTRDTKYASPDFRAGIGGIPSSSTTRALWQLLFCVQYRNSFIQRRPRDEQPASSHHHPERPPFSKRTSVLTKQGGKSVGQRNKKSKFGPTQCTVPTLYRASSLER